MAAVLDYFLPERYLRQSMNSRIQEQDVDRQRNLTTMESNASIHISGAMKNGTSKGNDLVAKDISDAEQQSEHSQVDEDEYREDVTIMKAPAATRLRKRRPPAGRNDQKPNKRVRRSVADSDEHDDDDDSSEAAGSSSSEEGADEAPWEAESETAEVEEHLGRDSNQCMFVKDVMDHIALLSC